MADKFIAYYRVSTDRQGRSGLGLEAQQRAVCDFLGSNGWELVAEYQEAESGKRDDRPELRRAVEHCRKAGAKLVIAKLDRLSRDAHFLLGLQKELERAKVGFVAADMPNANELTIGIMAVVAQDERRRIAERTREALAAAKARGVRLGPPEKAGREGRKLGAQARREQAQERAETVWPLVRELLDQGLSYRAVAKALNARGVPTAYNRAWHASTVQALARRMRGTV